MSTYLPIIKAPEIIITEILQYLADDKTTTDNLFEKKLICKIFDVFIQRVLQQNTFSIIFLDIDNVLFDFERIQELYEPDPILSRVDKDILNKLKDCYPNQSIYHRFQQMNACRYFFDENAVNNLISLIKSIKNAAIVLSSNWRTHLTVMEIKCLFNNHEFQQWIIDKTPDSLDITYMNARPWFYCDWFSRRCEISYWLNKYPHLKHYVIFDDVNYFNFSDLKTHWVQVDPTTLLSEVDIKQARDILKDPTE